MRRFALLILPAAAVAVGLLAAGTGRANTVSFEDDPTPREVIGYRNGRKFALAVVGVGGAEAEPRTAAAFRAMREAAARDGVELWARSGFRSHEQQIWLYQTWRSGWG